jgi:nitrate reductase NapE component
MEYQPLITPNDPRSVSMLLSSRKRSDLLLFSVIFVSVFCLVPILTISGIVIGFGYTMTILALLIISVLVIRWPTFGFFVVLGCTLLIEQNAIPLLGNVSNIYVFSWPPSLQGLPDRPIGFFMLFVLLTSFIHGLLKRQKLLQGGKLLLPYLCFLACVIWGIAHGLSTGGNLKITVNEVRPFWYLFLGYLLAYNLIRSKKQLYLVFWFIIICAGIKALEGVYIYAFIIHGDLSAHHDIMSHEESYFWVSILLLVMLFSLHYKYRPQFYTALALIPFLLIALIANNRRADFVALLVGMMLAWVLIFTVKPKARKLLVVVLFAFLLVGGAYVAAFYNGQGGFSEPARAVVSVFRPDPSDAASNLYRDIENYDLTYTVKLNPMGLGFGKPFLEPILLPDISGSDEYYNYIPHNTIYWVWMRLGPIGYLALWYLFGAMLARGCMYARQLKDSYLQLIAIYIVCMVAMEVIVAFADYQLFFYRNVIYIGILAGILMKLPALSLSDPPQADEVPQSDARLLRALETSLYERV